MLVSEKMILVPPSLTLLPVPGRSCQYSNQRSTMLAAKVSML
ncbi:Uncharacterised protein [Segatella copri]|nr:Uncharacterised protein [Segatella copri]